jgi:hypothetical protein
MERETAPHHYELNRVRGAFLRLERPDPVQWVEWVKTGFVFGLFRKKLNGLHHLNQSRND